MVRDPLTPFFALAASLAYVIDADREASVEEKARFLAVFQKHVAAGRLRPDDLKILVRDAFDHARRVDLDRFLAAAAPILGQAQRLAILVNLYDLMLVDGRIVEGERRVVQRFESAFGIDREVLRALREVVSVKNDTGLFLESDHPSNDPGYDLPISLARR